MYKVKVQGVAGQLFLAATLCNLTLSINSMANEGLKPAISSVLQAANYNTSIVTKKYTLLLTSCYYYLLQYCGVIIANES